MKFNKLLAVILLSLGLLSLAVAREEKFEENYKVEKAVTTDRQIASEKESDREPSSTVAPPQEEVTEAPQPWLHKSDPGSYLGH
jgi:hypothetical protein